MTVFVKTVGETFEIKVNRFDRIWKVKTKIEEVKDIQPRLQKLFFRPSSSKMYIALEDERSLDFYSIEDKSTLPMVVENKRKIFANYAVFS